MRILELFDLFPQHCIMPTFTREQHAIEVNNELKEAVQKLKPKEKGKILKLMSRMVTEVADSINKPPRRVEKTTSSEGEDRTQRVGTAPTVTTTTNPTGKRQIQTAPRTHQRVTRNNVPGATMPIIQPEEAPRKSQRLNPSEVEGF